MVSLAEGTFGELIDDCLSEIRRHLNNVDRYMLAFTCSKMSFFIPKVSATTLIREVIESGSEVLYEYFDRPEWNPVWYLIADDPANIAYFVEKIPLPALLLYLKRFRSLFEQFDQHQDVIVEFALLRQNIAEIEILLSLHFKRRLAYHSYISLTKLGDVQRVLLNSHFDSVEFYAVSSDIREGYEWIWKCRHGYNVSPDEFIPASNYATMGLQAAIVFNHFAFFVNMMEIMTNKNLEPSSNDKNKLLDVAFNMGRTSFVQYLLELGAELENITWTAKNTKRDLITLIASVQHKSQKNIMALVTGVPPFWPSDDTRVLQKSNFTRTVFAYFFSIRNSSAESFPRRDRGGENIAEFLGTSQASSRYYDLRGTMSKLLDFHKSHRKMTLRQIAELVVKINNTMDLTDLIKQKIAQFQKESSDNRKPTSATNLKRIIYVTQGIDAIREYVKEIGLG